MAQSGNGSDQMKTPDNRVLGAATIAALIFVLVAIASGIGAAIGFLGLAVLVVGVVAAARGGASWARIAGRRAAVAVAIAGFVAMGIGGAMMPEPKTDNTASEAPAPTTTATSSSSPTSTATAQPLVAAPATTTSQAPVRPVAPVMAVTCPTGGSVSSPVFGQQIAAVAPYTVTINYGDGDQYANDDQHLAAIFSHTYAVAGTYTVQALLTDAVGQTTSASCTYSWTKPVQVATGGSSGGSSGGGSATSGGTTGGGSSGGSVNVAPAPVVGSPSYANCDAVRAAGAAPIYASDPGFQQKFDRDNDGVGCE